MNHEKKNKEYYQNTFNEVHASEDLLRKVEAMKESKDGRRKKGIKKTIKFGYAVAAALVIAMISSNVIAYAATGSTWVEKVIVTVNGEEKEAEIEKVIDSDGNGYVVTTVEEEGETDIQIYEGDDKRVENSLPNTEIVKDKDKIYLMAEETKVADITKDIEDEKCEGTFELEGITYKYVVTGTADDYTINLSAVE